MASNHFEIAAKAGHPKAQFCLGLLEGKSRKFERALKHFTISARMGHKKSLNAVKDLFMAGFATKEGYKEALVGFRDATERMKSPGRDEAIAFYDNA